PAGNPVAAVCDVASADYVGVFGVGEPGVDGDGVFFRNSRIAVGDITDGTAATIVVGERSSNWASATWVGAVTGASLFPPPRSGADPVPYNSSNYVLGHTGESGGPAVPMDVNNFTSRHGRGANFAFADGHVAFLGGSVDARTFRALSTRAGGEPIPE